MINLRVHNEALLLKFLHKFYNKLDVPWVNLTWDNHYNDKIPHAADPIGSFWWKDILKLTHIFRGVSHVQIVDGRSTLFWKDLWKEEVLQTSHPRAFSFALHEDLSVAAMVNPMDMHATFHLPLSPLALNEVQDIQQQITWTSPSTSLHDVWHYSWGAPLYKPKDYYNNYFSDGVSHQAFRQLWKSRCTMKIKVFGWLMFHDRLNTRNMLKRRHYYIGDNFNWAVL